MKKIGMIRSGVAVHLEHAREHIREASYSVILHHKYTEALDTLQQARMLIDEAEKLIRSIPEGEQS